MSCLCKIRIPVCTWQDGSAPHNTSEKCICGTAMCSAETGMTCIAANSTCLAYTPCKFRRGRVRNRNVCGCGDVDCTVGSGFYCIGQSSICVVNAIKYFVADEVTTGSCSSSESRRLMVNFSECVEANRMLSIGPIAVQVSSRYYPPGCISHKQSKGVIFNAYKSNYNCDTTYSHAYARSGIHFAIGKMVLHHITHPVSAHVDIQCTPKTGLICVSENNSCTRSPACKFTHSSQPNSNTCACGQIDCTPTKGLYCYAMRSECSSDGNFDFFIEETSASCGSNGLITDHDTCDKARTTLGFAATSVTSTVLGINPTGASSETMALLCI